MKANITLGSPSETCIEVEGKKLNCVGSLCVSRVDGAVDLVATPHTFPTLTLNLVLSEVSASVDGDLLINAEPISEEVGRAIYYSLKERYEKEEQ